MSQFFIAVVDYIHFRTTDIRHAACASKKDEKTAIRPYLEAMVWSNPICDSVDNYTHYYYPTPTN